MKFVTDFVNDGIVWVMATGNGRLVPGSGIYRFFQKVRSHLQILRTWRLTWSKLHIEDPQFLSDMLTVIWRLLLGACEHAFLYVREKIGVHLENAGLLSTFVLSKVKW